EFRRVLFRSKPDNRHLTARARNRRNRRHQPIGESTGDGRRRLPPSPLPPRRSAARQAPFSSRWIEASLRFVAHPANPLPPGLLLAPALTSFPQPSNSTRVSPSLTKLPTSAFTADTLPPWSA